MPEQNFFTPQDLGEACSLLAERGSGAVVLAGGTDLMVRYNRYRRRRSEALVYLGKLGLDYITEDGGNLVVGATAPLAAIAASELIRDQAPLLAAACQEMASPAVRNAATLGGNVVTNARFADGVAALTALDAVVVVATTKGDRVIPMGEFARMPRKDKLAQGGIVKQFEIAPLEAGERWAWEKLKQRQGESRSVVSVSMRAKVDGGVVKELRLVLGAMAPNPFVSQAAAKALIGQKPSEELIAQAAEGAVAEGDPSTDSRASAWYRARAADALIRRVLGQLA